MGGGHRDPGPTSSHPLGSRRQAPTGRQPGRCPLTTWGMGAPSFGLTLPSPHPPRHQSRTLTGSVKRGCPGGLAGRVLCTS